MPGPSHDQGAPSSSWPRVCPNDACRTPLAKRYPACPACGDPLAPAAFKDRAEAAVARRLGLPEGREL